MHGAEFLDSTNIREVPGWSPSNGKPGNGNDDALVRSLIVASFAAGFAVHEAVVANANVDDRLAKTAIPFAFATVLGIIALQAAIFRAAASSAHAANLARSGQQPEITLVIIGSQKRARRARVHLR
jgi:hypothetical protein